MIMVAAIILFILAMSFFGLSFWALRGEESQATKSAAPNKLKEDDITWGVSKIREMKAGDVDHKIDIGAVFHLEQTGYTAFVTNKGIDKEGRTYIKYLISPGLTEGFYLRERVLPEEEFLRCYTTFKKDLKI